MANIHHPGTCLSGDATRLPDPSCPRRHGACWPGCLRLAAAQALRRPSLPTKPHHRFRGRRTSSHDRSCSSKYTSHSALRPERVSTSGLSDFVRTGARTVCSTAKAAGNTAFHGKSGKCLTMFARDSIMASGVPNEQKSTTSSESESLTNRL